MSRAQEQQNKQLLDLSNQILGLTKEVRAHAGRSDEDSLHNKELLDVSKRTLALTEALHRGSG